MNSNARRDDRDDIGTRFEVRDSAGKNIGECYDSTIDQAIDRAVGTADAIAGLGPLTVFRVTQRLVMETVEELPLRVVDAGQVLSMAGYERMQRLAA